MIIYTGQPIDNYHGYIHYIQKGDIKNHLFYRGDVVKTVLLQLQLLKEEYDMEQRLEPMEQLSYLWMYNQPHKFSEMCDLVKGVMKIHDKFMNSDEPVSYTHLDVYKRQVPGLCAKPIIDILLIVTDSSKEDDYVPQLLENGYILKVREPDWYEHRMFLATDRAIQDVYKRQ